MPTLQRPTSSAACTGQRRAARPWLAARWRWGSLIMAAALATGCATRPDTSWQVAWTASHNVPEAPPGLSGSTVRLILRPTADGSRVRVRLENTVGKAAVTFSSATLGVAAGGAAVIGGSQRALSFGGQPGLTLAPGAQAWSDPVALPVQAFRPLSLSLHVQSASDASTHTLGLVTNYIAPGNRAADPSAAGFNPVAAIAKGTNLLAFPVYWVGALEVSPRGPGAVVMLGDTITDGRCSTTTHGGLVKGGVVVPDLHQRWTDIVASRLAALPPERQKSVVNAGIAGNAVVMARNGPPAVDRLDRDVLALSGVTHVVFFEGTNDIAAGADAARVIAGMKSVIDRVRAHGLRIIGVTMIPRGQPGGGFTAAQERDRLEVNRWIRSQAGFDGVIDFAAWMLGGGTSETGAEIIHPAYNCDFIHPNAAGYALMGQSIDLDLFK